MHRNSGILKVLALFCAAAALAAGCDESIEFSNTPPGQIRITRSLCYLATGETVILTASAEDVDGDSVSYTWSAEDGTLGTPGPGGRSVSWTAPSSPGVYRVVATATDRIDSRSKSLDIEVGPKIALLPGEVLLDRTDYPYFIDGITPLRILPGMSMRITAGVTVIVNETTSGLSIEGSLVIEGEEGSPVVIRPNACPDEDGTWGGIRFSGADAVGDLEFLNVFSASTGITVDDMAHVEMRGVSIEESSGSALSLYGNGSARMEGCKIWDNSGGIFVENGQLDMTGSSIRYNSNYGLYIISSSAGAPHEALIDSCVIATNSGDGIVLSQYGTAVINYNSIFLNETDNGLGYGLKLVAYSGTDNIDARFNYWGADSEAGVREQIFEGPVTIDVITSGWLSEPPVE